MPTCCICQGDGILQLGTTWYCAEHLDDGFLAVADFLATVRRWDRDETRAALAAWLEG